MALTTQDREMLDLEKQSFKYIGVKETVIRESFGNVTHYYQHLNMLIDRHDALEAEPMLVRQLQGKRRNRVRRG